jgi:hypothetical protein
MEVSPGTTVGEEVLMPKSDRAESWVIYQAVTKGVVSGPNAVCELSEWEAMERTRPGAQCVVQLGIATEGAAERLARGTSGDTKPRVTRETVR